MNVINDYLNIILTFFCVINIFICNISETFVFKLRYFFPDNMMSNQSWWIAQVKPNWHNTFHHAVILHKLSRLLGNAE